MRLACMWVCEWVATPYGSCHCGTVPRSAVQLRRCQVRAVVITLVGTRANARKMKKLASHVMRWYVCLLCTVAGDNTRSSLLLILGRRNLVKLMFTKCIMFEQNELVRQYTLYYSALYFLEVFRLWWSHHRKMVMAQKLSMAERV